MRRILLLLCLALGFFMAFGQGSQVNLSLQVGYNFSRINPRQYNFAVDSIFNVENAGNEQLLSPARWGGGPTVSLALHRGRASFRLTGRLFSTSSTAFTTQVGSEDLRTDIALRGGHLSADITSRLVDLGRYTGFYVGAGLSANYFESSVGSVPRSSFDPDQPLTTTTENWKVGFKLHIPYRVVIPKAHVGFSVEPYFMVFFSNLDFGAFNEGLNGMRERTFSDSVDHFGTTFSVIFFLRE